MLKKLTSKVVVFLVMTATVNLIVGCNNQQATMPDDVTGDKAAGYITVTEQEVILDDDPEKTQILSANLSMGNVAAAKVWLEDQGYSYVDTNSLILIENEYEYVPVDRDNVDESNIQTLKRTPDERRLARADTVVWLAFENPTHDSANHTALLTHWRGNGEAKTILIELDISTEVPATIREGEIIEGEFVPGNVGLDFFWECMIAGAGAALVNCALSNCAYGHCLGGAAVVVTVGCSIGAALN